MLKMSHFLEVNRKERTKSLISSHVLGFEDVIMIVTGRSGAISTPNIRKITAIKKNRNENVSRSDLLGSKPHSNGELFSRSSIFFFHRIVINIIIVVGRNRVVIISVVVILIIYLSITNFLIGSHAY
jgi:hypothetical protein